MPSGDPLHRLLAWLQWPIRSAISGNGFENQRYLTKWLLLSTIIGIVAGLGAALFYFAIDLANQLLLGGIAGYQPPAPLGEGRPVLIPALRPWLIPLVTALGGLLSGIIVFTLAPDAEGHGTDSAIAAIHHKGGRIAPLIPLVKLVASALTIGSGGSAGREGPSAQISAGFASFLADVLRLNTPDRRIAVAAGMGAGIGAIFRAPLGGAVLAAEILYTHDLEVEALIPGLIASIAGYAVFGAFFGYTPIFGAQPQLAFDSPVQLLYYAALGLICGAGGILYARGFYGLAALFQRIPLPRWIKPALGGLLVGLIGLVIPAALGTGYGWLQITMTAPGLLGLPLWMVILLPFLKIVTTGFSIGSGGSGGIFGPGMVIGGLLGAAFWYLGHGILPNLPASPAPFIIIAMMALFGGIAHAPLAVMLMVAEMTGNLSLLAPAMVAVALSTALVGDNSIYRSQLPDRAHAPAHRVRFSFPLLASLLVEDALSPAGPTLRSEATLVEAQQMLMTRPSRTASVLDAQGRFAGVLTLPLADSVPPAERATTTVGKVAIPAEAAVRPDQTLDVALEKMSELGVGWLPVVRDGQLLGRVLARNIMRAYKGTLQRSVRRATALTSDSRLFEARLGPTSPLAGQQLQDAGLPPNTLVVSITRAGETIFPRANTRLAAGDVVLIMSTPAGEQALRTFLEGPLHSVPG